MRQLFLLLLASFLLVSAKNPPAEGIEFFQGSFTSAKMKAAKEGKLFFLDFTASWCTPCQWMAETTFTDPTLAAYVKENYVALQVDIDDFDGFALKQEYNIEILPSLLIFSSKGKLLGQYGESLSPSSMIAILDKYNSPENRIASKPEPNISDFATMTSTAPARQKLVATPVVSTPTPVVNENHLPTNETELPATFMVNTEEEVVQQTIDYTSNRPQTVGTISRNRLVKKEKKLVSFQENNTNTFQENNTNTDTDTEEYISFEETEEYQPILHNAPTTMSNYEKTNAYVEATTNETIEKPFSHLSNLNPSDNGEGLYRFEVHRQASTGYSVQVGAYAEYGNVLREASKMQEHFRQPVIVHISNNNYRTLYKLLLGEFETRSLAIDFMRTVQAKGLDCMIKDLSIH